ncbi:MAG TPA: cation transporter dimerization domain-containing protein [Roseiflexaceae bacterium]|nr:cation transporter dimerization domain-containing protein [Roseiflexaceae bacterium]
MSPRWRRAAGRSGTEHAQLIALLVAANIIWTGVQLVRRSALGLLDTALPAEELATIRQVLDRYAQAGVQFHALRTRQAGARRFVPMHVLVPGSWTVHRGHTLLEQIERDIRAVLPNATVFTHLEALDDPASWQDTTLDRVDAPADATQTPLQEAPSSRQ